MYPINNERIMYHAVHPFVSGIYRLKKLILLKNVLLPHQAMYPATKLSISSSQKMICINVIVCQLLLLIVHN